MPHPYNSFDQYYFWWLFLPFYFYPIFIIPFFIRKFSTIIMYSTIISGLSMLLFLCNGKSEWIILLYPLSAAIFSLLIRYFQLHKKSYQGKRQRYNTIWLYIVLPLLTIGFWPSYLIYLAIIKYWTTRPPTECRNNGRLIALSSDAVYRIYPDYGNSFWVITPRINNQYGTEKIFNVSTKKFCDAFSATGPRLVNHIDFSFFYLCNNPKTDNQKNIVKNNRTG